VCTEAMGCTSSKNAVGEAPKNHQAASRAVQVMVHVHTNATTPLIESLYEGGPLSGAAAIGTVRTTQSIQWPLPFFHTCLRTRSLTHARKTRGYSKKHSPSQAPTPATRSPAHPAAHSFPLARIVLHRVAPRVCVHVRNHALTHNLGIALCCRAEPAPCTK